MAKKRILGLEVDEATSRRLSRIRQHGTTPELAVRRLASGLGLRYRTRNRDLPGAPDLANRSKRWAIFVHGCYWHAHERCPRATVPKRNREFWQAKFVANRARDAKSVEGLEALGFLVITVWECELGEVEAVERRLTKLLRPRP